MKRLRHFSPVRLSSSASCLLSIRNENLLTISSLQTALDAPSVTLRAAFCSCRFVSLVFLPPASTCFLNHTNLPGADLDIRRMPAGGAPWMGRINYGYAFGRRHPLAAQICQEQIWTSVWRPQGLRQGRRTSKILRDHLINW